MRDSARQRERELMLKIISGDAKDNISKTWESGSYGKIRKPQEYLTGRKNIKKINPEVIKRNTKLISLTMSHIPQYVVNNIMKTLHNEAELGKNRALSASWKELGVSPMYIKNSSTLYKKWDT